MKTISEQVDTDTLMTLVPQYEAALKSAITRQSDASITSRMFMDADEADVAIIYKDSAGEQVLFKAEQVNDNDDDLWTLSFHDRVYSYVGHDLTLNFRVNSVTTAHLHF